MSDYTREEFERDLRGQTGDDLAAAGREAADERASEGAASACCWSPDDEGNYHTTCGNIFVFIDGGPRENDMHFCCYCGGRLEAGEAAGEGEGGGDRG